jgi:hypothetical protein
MNPDTVVSMFLSLKPVISIRSVSGGYDQKTDETD